MSRIWEDCLLGYCSSAEIVRIVLRVVALSDAEQRAGWLAMVSERARIAGTAP